MDVFKRFERINWMNINKVDIQLKYIEYFNPNFDWTNYYLYYHVEIFTDEFLEIFKNKINWTLFYGITYYCVKNKLTEVEDKNLLKIYSKYINKYLK